MANATNTGPAIYQWLAGDAVLTALLSETDAIYEGLAPSGTKFPYIVYDAVAPQELNLVSGNRTLDELWQIKAMATTRAEASAIAARVETRMIQQDITVTGWTVYWVSRETGFSFAELPNDGVRVYNIGADYRIRLAG